MKWIAVTDREAGKRENSTVLVRADSVDTMQQRSDYTTLRIHGAYLHVRETITDILAQIDSSQGD